MVTRLFLLGVITLFFGVQFRTFDSFVLNENVSRVINRRIEKRQAEKIEQPPLDAGLRMFGEPETEIVQLPAKRRITPPRWLGYSFLSIGAVLVLTCPLFRR